MITRTFIDKSTTIFEDNSFNYGLNPTTMLHYGKLVSRALLHFDVEKLKALVNDGTYPNKDLMRHILRMKNCGSIKPKDFTKKVPSNDSNGVKERATSFDIIAFKIPQQWDEGIGFDNSNDFWIIGKSALSQDGATWYNATNEELWGDTGIYSREILRNEVDAYEKGLESVIVGIQHFDHGNEDLALDITSYVNALLDDEENYGICLAFHPVLEDRFSTFSQYVGFFNNKTNTIYEPVLETSYDCDIQDDRMDFLLSRTNKLYLYSRIDGEFQNLDNIPTCTIDTGNDSGMTLDVVNETKGIYSVELKLSQKDYKKNTIMTDTWSNLSYNGDSIDDVEMEFVTKPSVFFADLNEHIRHPHRLNPIIEGIKDFEKMNRGEVRGVKVYFKEPYNQSEYRLVKNAWYRIYVKDGEREIDIVNWDRMLKLSTCNFFLVKTDELVPTDYHIDIKTKIGDNVAIFKDELQFKVLSNATNKNF